MFVRVTWYGCQSNMVWLLEKHGIVVRVVRYGC